MKNIKIGIILFCILLVGFFLRIYKIASVPPGLGNDEISIIYDAYSVINTGKDSYGAFLPLSFKSNNDYKPPLYAYTAGPFIKILGNNETAARLPSVIFGTLTILGIYLLVKKIELGENVAIFSAFLLAISPWHVYTSRIALAANLALFFLVFGVFFFLEGIKKGKYLFLSALFLALSLYAYHTERVFTPLIMIFSSLLYWKDIVNKKRLIYWWSIFLILIFPLVIDTFWGQGGVRASDEFILNDFILRNQLSGVLNIVSRLYIIFSFWLEKYLSYLRFGYIFTNGLGVSASYGISNFGLLNIFQLPLALLGILYASKTIRNKSTLLIIFWILVAPLICSVTEGEPNLMRNLISVIPLTILCSWGFIWIWEKWHSKLVTGILITILIFNFAFFYRYYITQFPYHFAEQWVYGYKQIAQYTQQNGNKYNRIIIDPRFGVVNNSFIGIPSLYILYFNKENPQTFLDTKSDKNGEFSFLNKYTIRNIDWTTEVIDKNSLYIVSSHSVPLKKQKMKEIYSISLPSGTVAFRFYQSN